VPELRVDVSDLNRESCSHLIKELASFLEEKANVKVETTANEIVLEGDEKFTIDKLRALLKEFIQKTGIKGKVKKGKRRKTLAIFKSRGKPIFCGKNGLWRVELDQHLQEGDEIVLLALGDVKYEVLAYLNRRKDIEIVKLETRQMKKREKGTGLKAIVRRRSSQALP
jgi:molybdopterin converting factor small subunit